MTGRPTDLQPAPSAGSGLVLIPVKGFDQAKGRLSDSLGPDRRSSLARSMATHLVAAQTDMTVAVCCDDVDVADWASSLGAAVIWCPEPGLNPAVDYGFNEARRAGYASVAIAHSDLPLATSLEPLLGWPGVTIVPDRHRTGSNVLCVPTRLAFEFSYGPDSYQRHVREAVRHGCGVRIVHDDRLGWDVDHPDDLDLPEPSVVDDLLERPTVS